MHRPATVASLLVAAALLAPAAPAHAVTRSISLAARAYGPAVATRDPLSGSITGSGVTKVAVQYYSGGAWRGLATTTPSLGRYVVSVYRTNVGVVPYRVRALSSTGATLATSRTIYLRWYKWQNVTTSSTTNATFSVCSITCLSDQTVSFNGGSYPHSVDDYGGGSSNPETLVDQYDFHVASQCARVRYTAGFEAGANSRNTGTVENITDGNGVSTTNFSATTPGAGTFATSGHDLISLRMTSNFYLDADSTTKAVVIGTLQAYCFAAI